MITSTQNPFSEDLASVVIPAYNHERYVQKTLQSILDQTYPCIELIIVNDGSTDHTEDQSFTRTAGQLPYHGIHKLSRGFQRDVT
jgi:GT2 family glycosyltransferase